MDLTFYPRMSRCGVVLTTKDVNDSAMTTVDDVRLDTAMDDIWDLVREEIIEFDDKVTAVDMTSAVLEKTLATPHIADATVNSSLPSIRPIPSTTTEMEVQCQYYPRVDVLHPQMTEPLLGNNAGTSTIRLLPSATTKLEVASECYPRGDVSHPQMTRPLLRNNACASTTRPLPSTTIKLEAASECYPRGDVSHPQMTEPLLQNNTTVSSIRPMPSAMTALNTPHQYYRGNDSLQSQMAKPLHQNNGCSFVVGLVDQSAPPRSDQPLSQHLWQHVNQPKLPVPASNLLVNTMNSYQLVQCRSRDKDNCFKKSKNPGNKKESLSPVNQDDRADTRNSDELTTTSRPVPDKGKEACKMKPQNQPRSRDDSWSRYYGEILKFRSDHGHCNVPSTYVNQGLYGWVKRQRYNFERWKLGKKSPITIDRIKALEEIGFLWSVHSAIWESRFEDFKAFVAIRGHGRVDGKAPTLSAWAKRQRRDYRRWIRKGESTMTKDRYQRLTSLGFYWNE